MSAGTEATHVRPLAVWAMEEIGIDISGPESKTLERYLKEPFDHVITVCDDANEVCRSPLEPKAGCTGPSKIPPRQRARRMSVWRSSGECGTGSRIECKRSW